MSHASAFTRIPFTYSICPRHPEYDGKSSSGRLLICSMGVSPSLLLCGPTANYGSIIITCTVIANPEAIRAFSYKFYRSSFRSHGAPTIRLNLSVIQDNVPDEWIFNFQFCKREIFYPSHLSIGTEESVLSQTFFQFFKNFIFFVIQCLLRNSSLSRIFSFANSFF